tara:strand:- start:1511 stop:2086 length:576 start_codon:yes stop_codon:yes gene_type:complete
MDKENKVSSIEKESDTESKQEITSSKLPDSTCDPPVVACDTHDSNVSDIENEPKQPDIATPPTLCECCNVNNSEIKFSVENVVLGKVSEIKTKTEFLNILNDAKNILAIVDFSATWCGPCKKIMPYIIKLAEIKKNVLFLKVDVDDNEETSLHCGVSCMPTFQFYKNNIKVHEIKGADINAIENAIDLYNR